MPHAGPEIAAKAQVNKRKIAIRRTRRNMKDEMKMDANRLIAEVYKRPALWNQRHMSYHNRELTNRVWMEIAEIFKLPKAVLKAKWKGLRDTFRAELKKEQVYRKSKYQRNRPLWIHFESLQFLKDQMLPRPPIWEHNTRSINGNEDEGPQRHQQNSLIYAENEYEISQDDSLAEHLLRSSIVRSIENSARQGEVKVEPEDQFNNLEYCINSPLNRLSDSETMLQNLSPDQVLLSSGRDGLPGINGAGDSDSSVGIMMEPFDGNHYDDNYYFLMSLLPHMKQLSAERRLFLRMKIQELVYKEVYKKHSVSTSTSKQEGSMTS